MVDGTDAPDGFDAEPAGQMIMARVKVTDPGDGAISFANDVSVQVDREAQTVFWAFAQYGPPDLRGIAPEEAPDSVVINARIVARLVMPYPKMRELLKNIHDHYPEFFEEDDQAASGT